MSLVWAYSEARGAAKQVLLALADYAGQEHKAWPSIATLAAHTKLHDRTVQNALRRLVSAGEIIDEGPNPHARPDRRSTIWRLNLGPKSPVDNSPERGGDSDERGGRKTFNGVVTSPPNPNKPNITQSSSAFAREENSVVDNAPAAPSQMWLVGVGLADDADAASFTRWLQEARNIRNPRGFLRTLPPEEIKSLIADFRRERPPPRPVRSEEEQIHMSDHTVGQHTIPADGCPMCVDGVPAGIKARRAWIENPTRFRLGGGQ